MRHEDRPPDVSALLRLLSEAQVEFVTAGSVAVAAHGVDATPGDLDIVPAVDRTNLERIVGLLHLVEAQPRGPLGHWKARGDGEQEWVARPTTEQELSEWRPDATRIVTMDHLFLTRFGNLDIVPALAGSFKELRPRAQRVTFLGSSVFIAHVDDLLSRLTVPRRPKDAARVAALRTLQRG